MSIMKKFLGTFPAAAFYFLLTNPALAASVTAPLGPTTDLCAVAQLVINAAFGLAALIAILFIIYGGIKWVISGGDKAAVEGARNTIIAALVGLIIVIISFALLNFGIGIIADGKSFTDFTTLIPGC